MKKYLLGFIGCGNMGGALIRSAAKTVAPQSIAICDFDEQKTATLQQTLGVCVTSAEEIAKESKFVVLGVKPQVMAEAIAPIAPLLQTNDNLVIITMAAGLSIAKIQEFIGKAIPTIRIMPNTPVNLGSGMIVYATDKVNEEEENEFLQAFKQAGLFDKIEEGFIDAAGALSGCGPAFAYAFARALAKGAEEFGIPQDKANIYAAQTLLGAGEMLLAYKDPDALIKAVCSPGGTTLAGMKALEDGEFEKIATSAVEAAYARTLELKK
jgi:pyrroline-5-carboxylate reductase